MLTVLANTGPFSLGANLTAIVIVGLIAGILAKKVKGALIFGLVIIAIIVLTNFVLPIFL